MAGDRIAFDRRAALAVPALAAALLGLTPPAAAAPPPLRYWGGINHGTGFFPDEPFLSACIRAGQELGLRAVRTRMNTVGGRAEGAALTWSRRDAAFDRYREAGFQLHCILSFREFVDRPDPAAWQRNWRQFVRAAMARYRDHVAVWIIDNEPENALAGSQPTPEECVAFTRIAWEELHDLGIADRCRLESPPVKALNSQYLPRMLAAGLSDCCHIVGTHGYNDQIDDGKIRYPWDQLKAAGIRDLPVGISESGAIAAWAPAGYVGGAEAWRVVFHRQLRVQAKAFGYDYALLFDLDRWRQREGEWRMAAFSGDGADYEPIEPIWTAIRDSWGQPQVFANGGFESPENGLGTWFVRHPARAAFPVELRRIDFPRDAAIARSGSGCCRMSLAGHRGDLVVRQVADGLTPGRTYRVSAHAYQTGGAATLKALGYDRLDGTAERTASSSVAGGWTALAVEVIPSNPWLVVELGSKGTDVAREEVRWDDVMVEPAP